MRIIHTADWHLCDKLGRNCRKADLEARVERVAGLCAEHRADVLLIAGDLFSEQATADEVTAALGHLRTSFAGFFAGGGAVLAVTGNHDRNSRIDSVRAGMALAVPDAGRGGVLPGGRMYLVNTATSVKLVGPGGEAVQFVLLPYPFPSRYGLSATSYQSKEEENRLLRAAVGGWLARKPDDAKFDQTLPTVLVAHLHVRGSEVTTAYKMTDRDDVLFDAGELHPEWRYAALGHIHKPQALGGETVRYPGSLDRLDFGETHDDHGVLFLEVHGADPVRPVRLPLPATPFHTITLTDPAADLPTLADQYPDRETAIVRLVVHPPAGDLSRDEVARQLRKLFPRWHTLDWADPARPAAADGGAKVSPRAGFEQTVRDYLATRLAADPDRAAVLALADNFLGQGGRP